MVDLELFSEKIIAKDVTTLGRAFTLNESTRLEDNLIVDKIIETNQDKLKNSLVISVSGIPGVGKSTFIETFGVFLHNLGNSIAVFTIDPTSELNHGSILGDKTRMNELSRLKNVFIRPSPSSNVLGGLGVNTHKNIDLAKIAGFDVILVETVGVGQSETIVQNLCDIFLLLLMPASGDELQGIKKGIMEIADFYVIHKADGDLELIAEQSKKEIEIALHMTKPEENISDKIFSFSSLNKIGLENIWKSILNFENTKKSNSQFETKRKLQRKYWLEEDFNTRLFSQFKLKYKSTLEILKSKIDSDKFVSLNEIIQSID